MSLIVAQSSPQGPRIVSDTRVEFLNGRQSKIRIGTLKAVPVSPSLAICFAGNVELGLDAIRRSAELVSQGHSRSDVEELLRSSSTVENSSTAFLVTDATTHSQITKIEGGEVEPGLNTAWIGDFDAFEAFQLARHGRPSPPEELSNSISEGAMLCSVLPDAMQYVINSTHFPTVGDFCATLVADQGTFMYLGSVFIHVGRDFTLDPNRELISQMVRPVSEGGYSVCVVEPEEPGTAALGLSFSKAHLATIYLPLVFDEAQVIEDVRPSDFPSRIFEQFGVRMKFPVLR